MKLCVVIPVYNHAAAIGRVVDSLDADDLRAQPRGD